MTTRTSCWRGAAEKGSTPLGVGGFGALRALSTRNDNPQAASRPWDRDRDGFVLGDGTGVMVLSMSMPNGAARKSTPQWSDLA